MRYTQIIQIFVFTLFIFTNAIAQDNDPNATRLLDLARQKVEDMPTYKFDFDIVVHREGKDTNQHGVYTAKGDKYIIETIGMELMSDGNYSYLFKNDKKDIEINDIDDESKELDLMKGPRSILNFYRTNTFTYQVMPNSESGNIIAFKPNDKDGGIVKIVLSLSDSNDLLACQIFMRDASNYMLKVSNFIANIPLEESLFEFNKSMFPDANIEDLRLD